MSRCSACLTGVLLGERDGALAAPAQPVQQRDHGGGRDQADQQDDPPQVGGEAAAEPAHRCGHEQQFLVTERDGARGPAAVEGQVLAAGAEEASGVLAAAEVDGVVEVRERVLGPAADVGVGGQRPLGVHEVAGIVRPVRDGVPERALLVEEVEDHEVRRRRGCQQVVRPPRRGELEVGPDLRDRFRRAEVDQLEAAVRAVLAHEGGHDRLEGVGIALRGPGSPGRAVERRPEALDAAGEDHAGLVGLAAQEAVLALVADGPGTEGEQPEHDDAHDGGDDRRVPELRSGPARDRLGRWRRDHPGQHLTAAT